jgi:hypothetical protein
MRRKEDSECWEGKVLQSGSCTGICIIEPETAPELGYVINFLQYLLTVVDTLIRIMLEFIFV